MSHIVVAVISVLCYWGVRQVLDYRRSKRIIEAMGKAASDISVAMFELGYQFGWNTAVEEPEMLYKDGLDRANLELKYTLTDAVKIATDKLKSDKP